MNVDNLIPLEYHGEKVLTTKQLADFYGCTMRNIRKNFAENKEQFIEGIHYYFLKDAALKEFKSYFAKLMAQNSDTTSRSTAETSLASGVNSDTPADLPFTNLASSLYLWTVQGAARHCKLVHTQKAWDIFNILELNYFKKKIQSPEIPAQNDSTDDFSPREKLDILIKLIEKCTDLNLRDDLIRIAFELLKPRVVSQG